MFKKKVIRKKVTESCNQICFFSFFNMLLIKNYIKILVHSSIFVSVMSPNERRSSAGQSRQQPHQGSCNCIINYSRSLLFTLGFSRPKHSHVSGLGRVHFVCRIRDFNVKGYKFLLFTNTM